MEEKPPPLLRVVEVAKSPLAPLQKGGNSLPPFVKGVALRAGGF